MQNVFTADQFQFPYLYKFPGQASDERILFVTRESEVMHIFRQLVVAFAGVLIFCLGYSASVMLGSLMGRQPSGASSSQPLVSLQILSAIIALIFIGVGLWWVQVMWKKSIALITNKRLTKFISTTPWTRHNLSLPLDMVVDTGAYSKGWLQAILRLGTFTARSSASSSGTATDSPGRINKKYFYIENVANAEDIHHYLHKVLFVFRQDWTKLESFRPFLPHLKGEARKEFMKQYPEYWS